MYRLADVYDFSVDDKPGNVVKEDDSHLGVAGDEGDHAHDDKEVLYTDTMSVFMSMLSFACLTVVVRKRRMMKREPEMMIVLLLACSVWWSTIQTRPHRVTSA